MSGGSQEFWEALLARLADRAAGPERYAVGLEINRGGMGRVYEVQDLDLRRRLAMKVMRGRPTDVAVARFLEEAQVTAQLDHPGIVPIHELGVDRDGGVYFTMKRVRGDDLSEVLRKMRAGDGDWNQTRAIGVLLRVCEAMAFAHERGVVHRDLKPANIMVGRFGETYVMDWGLAHVLGVGARSAVQTDRHDASEGEPESPVKTQQGSILGTPPYMSPEQARGKKPDRRSDVYSVGAILYELLGGEPPYVAATPAPRKAIERLLAGPPTPLTVLAPRTPPELIAICERAMARSLSDRYASMELLANDLRAYLENRVVRAHATGPIAEFRKWVARNRGVAAALAALIVVIAGAGYFIAVQERARADEFQLSVDLARAEELLAGEPVPDAIGAWLEQARAFVRQAADRDYARQLAEIRGRAEPVAEEAWLTARTRHPSWPALRFKEVTLAERERYRESASDEDAAILDPEIALLRRQVARLKAENDATRWRLASAAEQSRHERLSSLVARLADLAAAEDGRITLLERVRGQRAAADTAPAAPWRRAIASIADVDECPAYGGMSIARQSGLVPLRRDPASGLWEFWHATSGTRPQVKEGGGYVITPDTGMVMVLLAGGAFTMGSSSETDRGSWAREQPALRVVLAPYFLSKYEMTQGQWIRVAGDNPSGWPAGGRGLRGLWTRMHPVERIDHAQCVGVLRTLGLVLPTEAQFEFAARGGTPGAFWWGSERDTEQPLVNCQDDDERQDPYRVHAPVDAFGPNPFGFHCISGNVWEWCRDTFVDDYRAVSPAPGDGELEPPLAWRKTLRGGGYRSMIQWLRSANRMPDEPTKRVPDYGVRPARRLER